MPAMRVSEQALTCDSRSVTVSVTSSVPQASSLIHPMATSKARYEAFLINNVSTISTLESSLRSITWFLPGRFKDAELASEARPYTSFLLMNDLYI